MKLFDLLKQFKNIEPNAEYSQHSRTEILLSPQSGHRTLGSVFTFLHVIETGVAVSLAGFFMFILASSFSSTRSTSPIQYAVIDPTGLHAEAQAIDMQIQLANIGYPQVTSSVATGSTVAAPVALKSAFVAALRAQVTSTATTPAGAAGEPASIATTTELSVDQALQQLSR
jgi:hypothetical protein